LEERERGDKEIKRGGTTKQLQFDIGARNISSVYKQTSL
jgi:hypothetical protein